MRCAFSSVVLLSIAVSSMSQDFGQTGSSYTFTSLNGGLSMVTGSHSSGYNPGFTAGLNLLYRPIKQLGVGISPFFSRWGADIPSGLGISGSDNNIGLNGVVRGMAMTPANVNPYVQIGTGANILISAISTSTSSDTHTETYWGMVFGGGVVVKNIDIGMTYGFIQDNGSSDQLPWIAFTLGYAIY